MHTRNKIRRITACVYKATRTYVCNVTARRRARTLFRAIPFYRFAPVTAENFLQLRRKPVARTFSQRGDKIRGRPAGRARVHKAYLNGV